MKYDLDVSLKIKVGDIVTWDATHKFWNKDLMIVIAIHDLQKNKISPHALRLCHLLTHKGIIERYDILLKKISS